MANALILAGVVLLAWAFVVWQWNDPFTSLYTRWEQRQLDAELAALVEDRERRAPATQGATADPATSIPLEARRSRRLAQEGDPIGRLRVPRLDLEMVMVNGTSSGTLKRGPGRHLRTFMPGEGHLVYIAGHRTTYGAPFAHIDRLKPGDPVILEMPYGTFRYTVTGHRIVDARDRSVLRSQGEDVVALQACHPRFFATQRYIVWAKLERVTPPPPD
jgi:sortase A